MRLLSLLLLSSSSVSPRSRLSSLAPLVVLLVLLALQRAPLASCSLVMKRLYEDLFTDYNRLILPVAANKTKVTVTLGLKLGQILDLNLKQQILSTNVWVEQTWFDHRLEWDPNAYGGIDMIHVPAENIWIPDIVLFNNADGNYELTLVAKAVLYANGTVVWKPPTMFRSTCEIDVEYFPFDIQTCYLRFGSWTYAGDEIEIKHVDNKRKVDIGIDLSQFYKNVEWDIIDVPAYYNEAYYECCPEPFPDITFKIVIRRKMLFYLVNLILPVALMTFMTVSVFYLPADSNEKVTLSISILTSLIVFFLLMLEVIPPTSLAVPLFGKYLLFTLVLVSLSACVSVYVLNIYHRAPSVHQMSPRMRQIFLKTLPRLLRLNSPDPRERSSLNRFRQKKIAQQILQARQHSKVYDLAQPMATSLNLIEVTLQKSRAGNRPGDFNAKDDDLRRRFVAASQEREDGEEEGRYFRRYIDNFIGQLESTRAASGAKCPAAAAAVATAAAAAGQSRRRGPEHQSSSSSSARTNTNMTCASARAPARCCSANNKCCSLANRPLRPAAPSAADAAATRETSFEGARQAATNPHDDTFDMTFDYDDPDQSQPGVGRSLANLCPGGRPLEARQQPLQQQHPSQVGRAAPIAATAAADDLAEAELPSPPPPPRQLTQLSDSMKDLSGRVSSCSQQQQHAAMSAGGGGLSPAQQHLSQRSMDCAGPADGAGVNGQLVDKLISSIHMINNGSDDMDTPTTTTPTSNNDEEYRHLRSIAQTLNSGGPPISLARPTSELGPQTRAASGGASKRPPLSGAGGIKHQDVECTCESQMAPGPDPMGTSAQLQQQQQQQHQQQQQQPQQQSFVRAPLKATTNTASAPSQHAGVLPADTQAGTNIAPHRQPSELLLSLRLPYDQMPDHVRAAIRSILFIADTIKNEDDENSAIEDWESMSMVVDRLFLWIFFLLCTFGSFIILALAPSLYDQRDSIDDKLRVEIPESNCSAFHKNPA